MKKFTTTLLFTLSVMFTFAQSPQKMTYQAVVRDAGDVLVSNTPIGMQISILQTTPTGVAVYIETQVPTTNINGLATIEIGNGTVVAGNFSTIDWSAGPYYLKTETDPTGGTVYSISATSQLLSVPYALYAENSGNGFSGDYNDLTNTPPPVTANTLDGAYDEGGAGAGRIITADSGPVEINSGIASQAALSASHSGNGVSILADNSSTATTFPTIQASTASTSNLVSAVIGNSTGAAWGVSGQVTSAASAEAAVYGNNLRLNGGYGVKGVGYNGVWGLSSVQTGAGTWGENSNINGTGIAGIGNGQIPQVLAAGSGGSFVGVTNGLFGKFNSSGVAQGMTLQDAFGAQWLVGSWTGATYNKISGNGGMATVVQDLNDEPVLMIAPEAPEYLFEDYGQGQLVNGQAHIEIDPIFSKNIVVNEEHPLRVFVTLEGDCNGVFVTNKSIDGFDVKELAQGNSNVNFTYQIVANRSDEVMPSGRVSLYSEQRFQPTQKVQKTETLGTSNSEQRALNMETHN